MAEVRLRLLQRSAQFPIIEDVILGGRAREAVLAPFCAGNRETAECSHRKRTLWPYVLRGQYRCVPGDMPQFATPGVRFYSQGSGPRASFHQAGGRHRGYNNGSVQSEAPMYTSRTGYYDILEISGNATQAQIKTAYYKQSFRFHPDRNAGNEAASRRFGQVTEAYHVLGSTSLRKKYDRGILSLEDVRTARKPSGKSPSRKEAAGPRQASSASSTFTPSKQMFDFDAFYQAHYGEQLAREKLWKERREQIAKERKEKNIGSELNKTHELIVVFIVLPTLLLYFLFKG
ncbi:dnaJ homolog subfamily C member 30, mitochondrial [Rana temporaria]|uniref:dnaJ homolog subfamily C member 30, mitochondrial n=1 Tax=Rana temporaria TaxID=8407 RepID=UPI001AAC9DB8|nr:dnaJ homolog subfamily C member 30, mitochondrial [Rana temporaria]